jgi:hypothetical protein
MPPNMLDTGGREGVTTDERWLQVYYSDLIILSFYPEIPGLHALKFIFFLSGTTYSMAHFVFLAIHQIKIRILIRINLQMTKPKCMEYEPIWELFSRIWTFIWQLGSEFGSASKWEVLSAIHLSYKSLHLISFVTWLGYLDGPVLWLAIY